MLILDPKMSSLPHSLVFTQNNCHHVQFRKNLMNRFREKIKNVDFGPKNAPLNPF